MKKFFRVLLFSEYEIAPRPDFDTLSKIASVKHITWNCKPFPGKKRFFVVKIPYRILEGLYWVSRLLIEIRNFQANVVVARYAYFCGLIGTISARLSGKKAIVRVVGSDLKIHSKSMIGKMSVLLIFRIASGVICVSKDLEEIAQSFGAKCTEVIPDALDLPDYDKLTVEKKDIELITVTRLIKGKGISYLIRAMTFINDGKLVVIGEGPERRKLESLSQNLGLDDRVFFVGWINDRITMARFLSRAKVFVFPSLSEGTPRVIIEAMWCGLPIVATNVGGIPEVLEDGVNALLVPPKNEKALAEAINKALSDAAFQRIASIKNREDSKRFFLPAIAQSTYNYFLKICEQK